MEEKDIVVEIEKETRGIERLLKVLKAYYIEDNLKNNYIKLKSD